VRKRNRHYLSKLWDWANEQGWFEPLAVPKQQSEPYRFYETVAGKVPFSAVRLTQRRQYGRTDLSFGKATQQACRAGTFALGTLEGDVINPALQAQLEDLQAFMTDGRWVESNSRKFQRIIIFRASCELGMGSPH
jgi:hypothetical protein